jgi:uncharacterized protein YaiI (UPF0178 family)
MNIWVDADACPVVIKDILFRAAERTHTQTTLIANHAMRVPPSQYISLYQVTQGFDVADDEIVKRLDAGDLVISSDIPLAAEAIEKGAVVLSPRGELYTVANIKARLTMRDFMDNLRSSGIDTGGPPVFNQNDRKQFADKLDALLRQNT